MRYVFEKGNYPNIKSSEDKEFPSDLEAIEYAKNNEVDYVWSAPEDRNPNEIYKKKKEIYDEKIGLIVAKHYNLKRKLSEKEISDELNNLIRKENLGNLDDSQESLLAEIQIKFPTVYKNLKDGKRVVAP